jgi:DNA-binding transcriptional ArsR family regulator
VSKPAPGGAGDDPGSAHAASLDEAVRAVGHPGRRAMLRLARDGEQTAADLAQAAGLSASAASQHLKVLRDTGLLDVRADAQRRLYQVNTARLAQVRALLDELWSDRLSALTAQAEADERAGRPIDGPTEHTA